VGGKLSSGFASAREGVNKFGNSLMSIQGAIAGAGLYKMISFAADAVREFGEGQRAVMDLTMTLEGMGKSAPGLVEKFQSVAQALHDASVFDDDDIVQGMATLAGFAAIANEQMPAAAQAAVDLAAKLGIDVPQAAKMVGQASGGMTGALSKYGIRISDVATKSGDFGQVLEEMNKRIAGSAEAFANTGIGSLQKLERYWGDLKEKLGGRIVVAIGIVSGAAALTEAANRARGLQAQFDMEAIQNAGTTEEAINQAKLRKAQELIDAMAPKLKAMELAKRAGLDNQLFDFGPMTKEINAIGSVTEELKLYAQAQIRSLPVPRT